LDSIEMDADSALAQRAYSIQASMARTYQALPKNEYGHLGSRSVLYLVQTYFAKEHGWLINGLEPQGTELSVKQEVQDVVVLQEKVPSHLMAILAARHADRGLSFDDIVAMVAFLERLILNESIDLLDAAYSLNNRSTNELLDEAMMHDVLTSYLYVFRDRRKLDYEQHQSLKEALSSQHSAEVEQTEHLQDGVDSHFSSMELPTLADFEGDELLNMVFERRMRSNPFRRPLFSFDVASRLVDRLAQKYGKWQNEECLDMKTVLMSLDAGSAGLVPLDRFYMHTSEAGYQFWESKEYLRQVGALDESLENRPRVRITNYVLGPSNCIASSEYFSVCCLNECKALMSELEGHIKAPVASPRRILRLVSNMSSSSIEAPRQLHESLESQLRAIAEQSNGRVHLHGRLFAQWLHHAFPNECPYPWIPANVEVSQVKYWGNDKHMASAEEMAEHIRGDFVATGESSSDSGSSSSSSSGSGGSSERRANSTRATSTSAAADLATSAGEVASPLPLASSLWSSDDVLPLLEPEMPERSPSGGVLHLLSQIALFIVAGNFALLGGAAAIQACRRQEQQKKAALPMYF